MSYSLESRTSTPASRTYAPCVTRFAITRHQRNRHTRRGLKGQTRHPLQDGTTGTWGIRHELGGKKGRWPKKCAGLVRKVLVNAVANARNMGEDPECNDGSSRGGKQDHHNTTEASEGYKIRQDRRIWLRPQEGEATWSSQRSRSVIAYPKGRQDQTRSPQAAKKARAAETSSKSTSRCAYKGTAKASSY